MSSYKNTHSLDWTWKWERQIVFFSDDSAWDSEDIGSKGSKLCEMKKLGLNVPPGFIITAQACRDLNLPMQRLHSNWSEAMNEPFPREECYLSAIEVLEKSTRTKFGGGGQSGEEIPLLLALRPSSSVGLSGVSNTVLNVGLNDAVVAELETIAEANRIVLSQRNFFSEDKEPAVVEEESALGGLSSLLHTEEDQEIDGKGEGRGGYDGTWVLDLFRRFLTDFGVTVLGVEAELYSALLTASLRKEELEDEVMLSRKGLQELIEEYKLLGKSDGRCGVPEDPRLQLRMVLRTMYSSWFSAKALEHRRCLLGHSSKPLNFSESHVMLHNLDYNFTPLPNIQTETLRDAGGESVELSILPDLAIVVQQMVHGNSEQRSSGTGVVYSRDPNSGAKELYGEYLHRSEGDDIIRGQYTAQPIAHLHYMYPDLDLVLKKDLLFLETTQKCVQVVEIVIQVGELFYLSSREALLSPMASVSVAVDLVKHHVISRQEAVLRLDPTLMDYFLQPFLDPTADISNRELGRGLNTSQGIVSGKAVFSLHDAKVLHDSGISPILILEKCCFPGESVSVGVDPLLVALGEGGLGYVSGLLVLQGGVTSPLVELTRNRGIPVVSGASKSGLYLDNYSTRASPCIRRKESAMYTTSAVTCAAIGLESHPLNATEMVIQHYQEITLDGRSGRIFRGIVPAVTLGMDFYDLVCMRWVDHCRRLRVSAEARSIMEAKHVRELRGDGLGMYRLEGALLGSQQEEGGDKDSETNSDEDSYKVVEWLLGVLLQSPKKEHYLEKLESLLVSQLVKLLRLYVSQASEHSTATLSCGERKCSVEGGECYDDSMDSTCSVAGSGIDYSNISENKDSSETVSFGSELSFEQEMTETATGNKAKKARIGESSALDPSSRHSIAVSLLDLSALPFLVPNKVADIDYLAAKMMLDPVDCANRLLSLHLYSCSHPHSHHQTRSQRASAHHMLRGGRLARLCPLLVPLQVRAILTALLISRSLSESTTPAGASEAKDEKSVVDLTIVIPMVDTAHELNILASSIYQTAKEWQDAKGSQASSSRASTGPMLFNLGISLDTPRACMCADSFLHALLSARSACCGMSKEHQPTTPLVLINTDLITELVYGIGKEAEASALAGSAAVRSFNCAKFADMSTSDSTDLDEKALHCRVESSLFSVSPFLEFDTKNVGPLVEKALKLIRNMSHQQYVQVGIIGKQCNSSGSVDYFERIGVDALCCSGPTGATDMPAAKVAAAQAHIRLRAHRKGLAGSSLRNLSFAHTPS